MPNPSLHGNHTPCPDCDTTDKKGSALPWGREEWCRKCQGIGFVALDQTQIARRTAAEACQTYWPQFEQRITQQKETIR